MNEEQKEALKILISKLCCNEGDCELCFFHCRADGDDCDGIGYEEFESAVKTLKPLLQDK